MKGVLLVSHGESAKGLVNSARYIMGDQIRQLAYCCYTPETELNAFREKLKKSFDSVDGGEGVIILIDVMSGVTFQEAAKLIREDVDMIAGVNTTMLLEVLTKRIYQEDLDLKSVVEKSRMGIYNIREKEIHLSQTVE